MLLLDVTPVVVHGRHDLPFVAIDRKNQGHSFCLGGGVNSYLWVFGFQDVNGVAVLWIMMSL